MEIDDLLSAYSHQERDRLVKYYLVRSIFASVVEAIILLDRLAFLLEQVIYIIYVFFLAMNGSSEICFPSEFNTDNVVFVFRIMLLKRILWNYSNLLFLLDAMP